MAKNKSITITTSWDDKIVCTRETKLKIGLVRDGNRMGAIYYSEIPHKDDNAGLLEFINEIEDWMVDNEF